MTHGYRRLGWVVGLGLLIAVSAACNLPGLAASPTPTQAPSAAPPSPTSPPPSASPIPPSATPSPTASPAPTTAVPAPTCDVAPAPGLPGVDTSSWLVYCNLEARFSFKYPPGGGPPVAGSTGTQIFLPIVPGTNLLEKFVEASVARGGGECVSPQAAGYAPGSLPTSHVTVNGFDFTLQSGADAGAGNLYEWEGYATARGDTCVSLTFVLHSANRMNYATPPPEFDKAAESAVFQAILATFAWPQ